MAQLADELPGPLSSWLPKQTWFVDGNRTISLLRVTASITLLTGEPALDLVLLRVEFADGGTADYQLLVGRRRLLSSDLHNKAIGVIGDTMAYDGPWDPHVANWLLSELANADTHEGLRFVREPDADVPREITSRVLSDDSIKTSLAYANECTLKLFHRTTPVTNLDLELHRALRRVENKHVAQLRAAIELNRSGDRVTLGMLHDFVTNPTEGWAMVMVSVRDLLLTEQDLRSDEVGGDFAPEACRLGRAVAITHADLARTLGIGEQNPRNLAEAMNARLSVAESTMPALSEHASSIRAAYAEVGKLDAPISTQRIHGDLHLHNILRTTDGWLLINFGGEAARPLFERARPASVLRDVGRILRSLDHAARYGLTRWGQSARSGSRLERRADEWSARNMSAFCDGYAEFAGVDPREQSSLLLAYELDRTVYESIYNAHDCPNRYSNEFAAISRLIANL
jgi:maltokinase